MSTELDIGARHIDIVRLANGNIGLRIAGMGAIELDPHGATTMAMAILAALHPKPMATPHVE